MIDLRIPRPLRAAAAALLLALASCGDEVLSDPRVLAGNWLAVETNGTQQYRLEDRLELRDDGTFTWISAGYSPNGRAPDGLGTWESRTGSWRVEGGWFALRTTGAMAWEHGSGWSQIDTSGEWHRGHRLRMENGGMVLEEQLPMHYSRSPRTFVFVRVAVFDDAPPPPTGP
jgi:hypothetical protein